MASPRRRKRIIRKVMPTSRIAEMAEAMAGVLGSDKVHFAEDSDLGEPRMFIPSGVPALDGVLDREERGWPVGRIVEIYGGEATAKTGLGYALIAAVQKAGGDGTLHPSEGNVDHWLMDCYDVDQSRLIIGDDETVEGTFKSFSTAMRVAGRKGLLVGVIDSIAGLVTREELEDEEFDRDRAAQIRALLISKAMRKLGARVPRTNTILFCINQVRDSTASTPSKPKSPGGRALKFYASIRLRMELIKKIRRQIKGRNRVSAFHVRITAEKNRLADPYAECEIVIDFKYGLFSAKSYTEGRKAAIRAARSK